MLLGVMIRVLTLIFLGFSFPLAAQTHGEVFRKNCDDGRPHYRQWFQSTRLPYGEPYQVSAKRKEQLLQQYPKVAPQMSVEQVEEILGKPDFSSPSAPGHGAASAEEARITCSEQLAYVVKKESENMADMHDEAIYLFFSVDGKLYWATPQNLPLKELGSPTP